MTNPGRTGTARTNTDVTANRVKPPLPGMPGGILGTAFALGAGRGSGRPLDRACWTGGTPDSFTTPQQELHPYDDGH